MTIVIGCDSFLALRNIRNGNLREHLLDQRIVVLVDPRQYRGSLEAAPPGIEIGCLLDIDARKEPSLTAPMNRAYMARKCFHDPVTIWQEFKLSSYKHNRRNKLRRTASLAHAVVRLTGYWI